MERTLENGKYVYRTTQYTDQFELTGRHNTVAFVTPDQALSMASALIEAARNPNEEGNVVISFDLEHPYRNDLAPEASLYFGNTGRYDLNLHWAMVEGHEIYSLSNEYMEASK